MTTAVPRAAREVRLAVVPSGLPGPEHFTVAETPLTPPGAGRVLVRNQYFSVFPALRTLFGTEIEDTPLPGLRSGDALFGPAVGEVVAAPADSPLRPGDQVVHMLGWRDYALVEAAHCTPVDPALPDPVAHLGLGSVAYGALTRLAPVREGDTVLVTGAAGAVGSVAGQIARLLGAGRVIGSTGSPAKAERLKSELGYDAVVLRGAGSFAARLAEAAPDGIDVLLDLVAGEQLTAAVDAARPGARFALAGTLSAQLSPHQAGDRAPVEIDAFRVVVRGISLRGYSGADHPEVEREWTGRFGAWLRAGDIRFPHVRIAGLDRAPEALRDVIAGRWFGAVIVEL
ncbi:MDR family NADP-dependent oxidoreductase [Streptomyces sp. NPDC014894]|uniref:MDR family NADP-dependent oxidoreductase n=1 Tax=Streptomyces sp. NPDC014894 TaxID=3364931 RepID=UPI0036FB91CB